jgi:hypothetical protein
MKNKTKMSLTVNQDEEKEVITKSDNSESEAEFITSGGSGSKENEHTSSDDCFVEDISVNGEKLAFPSTRKAKVRT